MLPGSISVRPSTGSVSIRVLLRRRFGSFTENLLELVGWLKEKGITTVAMEATGVYWRELYTRIEEGGMEARLVDPRKTRNPRGRKTDMQDCQWIWQMHAHGLLDGAFVPGPEVQQLRTYLRFRHSRVEQAGIALKEMPRALSLMNIKLQHVISDIGGTTGMQIIEAILGGERDCTRLAKLRDHRCKSNEATIAKALRGTWRAEHLFLLRQAHTDYRHHHDAIAACDTHLDDLIQKLPAQGPDDQDLTPKPPTGKNDFHFDAQKAAHRLAGIDLTGIAGIGPNTALSLLGEVGFDLKAWPTAKAFCAWLGLCPNPKRSGGKHLGNLPHLRQPGSPDPAQRRHGPPRKEERPRPVLRQNRRTPRPQRSHQSHGPQTRPHHLRPLP